MSTEIVFGISPNSSGRRKTVTFVTVCLFFVLALLVYIALFATESQYFISFCPQPESSCPQWMAHFHPMDEEIRVFGSLRREHQQLYEQLVKSTAEFHRITAQIVEKNAELQELELRISELQAFQSDLNERRNVRLQLPNPPLFPPNPPQKDGREGEHFPTAKNIDDVVDFSRCSISTQFPVCVYPPADQISHDSNQRQKLLVDFFAEFQQSPYFERDPEKACFFVAIFSISNISGKIPQNESDFFASHLEYWRGNGRNHLILLLPDESDENDVGIESKLQGLLDGWKKAAMFAFGSSFAGDFRLKLDFSLHLDVPDYSPDLWRQMPKLLPFTRKYLISFFTSPFLSDDDREQIERLKNSMDQSMDQYLIQTNCSSHQSSPPEVSCFSAEERMGVQKQSMFSLLLPSPTFQRRFYETLLSGSIPVIVGLGQPLPFEELIDWRQAVIQLPRGRFPELHFFIRSIPPADLLEMRRKGRLFFENFLANKRVLVESLLSVLRYRLRAPGRPLITKKNVTIFEKGNFSTFSSTATRPPYDSEYLGPVEIPQPSDAYMHNISAFYLYAHSAWNQRPFESMAGANEFLLDAPSIPSDAEFGEDTRLGLRPIAPGSGDTFARALGGNWPREQFTVVITTHRRDQILADLLEQLNKLPYLNKIVVIWNNEERSPTERSWPQLSVPLVFVAAGNSLNNRFLPLAVIETEAVLSLDDDIDLKHYEIMFAFRIWREHREQIVGFPARFHAHYEGSGGEMDEGERGSPRIFYNSNHTCQLSMILTGAAFIHKSYFHAYWHWMPEVIRQRVDEWMNCEDIAMNFLVAHLSRKPPVKVTSKWTLRCPSCAENLSLVPDYFSVRAHCLRFFTEVYGYNPLLYSQHRMDSVLFKTRLPVNHQKCFRFV